MKTVPLVHSGRVDAVAFTTSGTNVCSAGMDGTRCWSAADGRERWHCRGVFLVAPVAGGDDLVGAVGNGLVILDGATGEVRTRFETGRFMPSAIAVSLATPLVATASGTEVRLWDLTTSSMVREFVPAKGTVQRLAIAGDRLFALAYGKLIGWDLASGAQLFSMRLKPRVTEGLTVRADGKRVFIGGPAEMIQISLDKKKPVESVLFNLDGANALALSPDGARLAVASKRGLETWDLSGRLLEGPLPLSGNTPTDVAFSPAGDRIAVASLEQTTWLCLPDDARTEASSSAGHRGAVLDIAVRGEQVLTGGADGAARIWDRVAGQSVEETKGPGGSVVAVAWEADGTRHLVARNTWSRTGLPDITLEPEALSGVLDPGGQWFLGRHPSTLVPWLQRPGQSALEWKIDADDRVTHMVVSADGRFVALGIEDERNMVRTVEVRHAPGGGLRTRLSAPTLQSDILKGVTVGGDSALQAIAISPDGASVAAAAFRGPIVLWDVATGAVRAGFPADDLVVGLTFAGPFLVAALLRKGLIAYRTDSPEAPPIRQVLAEEPSCVRALPPDGLVIGLKRGGVLFVHHLTDVQ